MKEKDNPLMVHPPSPTERCHPAAVSDGCWEKISAGQESRRTERQRGGGWGGTDSSQDTAAVSGWVTVRDVIMQLAGASQNISEVADVL